MSVDVAPENVYVFTVVDLLISVSDVAFSQFIFLYLSEIQEYKSIIFLQEPPVFGLGCC